MPRGTVLSAFSILFFIGTPLLFSLTPKPINSYDDVLALLKERRESRETKRWMALKKKPPAELTAEEAKFVHDFLKENVDADDIIIDSIGEWKPGYVKDTALKFMKATRESNEEARKKYAANPDKAPPKKDETIKPDPPKTPSETAAKDSPPDKDPLDDTIREMEKAGQDPRLDQGSSPEAPADMAQRNAHAADASERARNKAGNMAKNILSGASGDDGGFSGRRGQGGDPGRGSALGQAGPARQAFKAPGAAYPKTDREMLLASLGGYKDVFDRHGLKADSSGKLSKDGRPALPREIAGLRQDIGRETAALAKRPDFHQVHSREHFQDVKRSYRDDPSQRDNAFKHIRMTPERRDQEPSNAEWFKNCEAVSGECNKYAKEKSYKKDTHVSPETLENIWAKALKAVKERETARMQSGHPSNFSGDRAKNIWSRLSGMFGLGGGPSLSGDANFSGAAGGEAVLGYDGYSSHDREAKTSSPTPTAGRRTAVQSQGRSSDISNHKTKRTSLWLLIFLVAGAILMGVGFHLRRSKD